MILYDDVMGKFNSLIKDKVIVVTRSQEQQADAKHELEELGAYVLDFPALVLLPPDDWEPLDIALRKIKEFDWIIFSSINGVRFFSNRLAHFGIQLKDISKEIKIASVGKKTALALEEIGVQINFVPPQYIADSLIEHFPDHYKEKKILLPRVQTGGRTFLAKSFVNMGSLVTEVSAYESSCPLEIPRETYHKIDNLMIDAMLFTSGKIATNVASLMKKEFGNIWHDKLSKVKLISIGPQTSLSCIKNFRRVDKEANPHDLSGLIDACIDSFKCI
tara:strand:- start:675 stop:1499 length:825 start_codon:yes stop_codon:yes gene_type:complete